MRYRERITVKADAPSQPSGTQDPESGDWIADPTNPPRTTIDHEPCDVQEMSLALTRTADGTQASNANVLCFLRDEAKAALIAANAPVTIDFADGSAADAEVQSVRRIDGALVLRYLR